MNKLANRKAKIKWQCRRGMLELDLLFEQFNKDCLANLTDKEVDTFAELLETSDQQLYEWLMEREKPQSVELQKFVNRIAMHPYPK